MAGRRAGGPAGRRAGGGGLPVGSATATTLVGVDIQAEIAQVAKQRPAPFAGSSAWLGRSERVTYVLRP
jgi:hypothetical protein